MIVVFGSLNVDVVMQVNALPKPGETVIGGHYFTVQGGKGANQALAAARAAPDNATKVAMVGRVGKDDWGRFATERLAEAGVDLSCVQPAESPTGYATICVDAAGENAIAVASGANMDLTAEQVDDAWLQSGDWLVMQMEVPAAENWRVAAHARSRGAKVLLNVAPASVIPEEVLASVDVLVVNEIEAGMVAGAVAGSPDAAKAITRDLSQRHNLSCITTLGADGAVVASPDGSWQIDALPIQAVDTTGAGDAFVGVLAASLHGGSDLLSALRRAIVGAGLSCMTAGAQSSFAAAADIDGRIDDLAPPRPTA